MHCLNPPVTNKSSSAIAPKANHQHQRLSNQTIINGKRFITVWIILTKVAKDVVMSWTCRGRSSLSPSRQGCRTVRNWSRNTGSLQEVPACRNTVVVVVSGSHLTSGAEVKSCGNYDVTRDSASRDTSTRTSKRKHYLRRHLRRLSTNF